MSDFKLRDIDTGHYQIGDVVANRGELDRERAMSERAAEKPTARIDELMLWTMEAKGLPDSTVISVGYWTDDPLAMLGQRFDAVIRTTLGDLRKQFPPVRGEQETRDELSNLVDAANAAWRDLDDWRRLAEAQRATHSDPQHAPQMPTEAGIAETKKIVGWLGRAIGPVENRLLGLSAPVRAEAVKTEPEYNVCYLHPTKSSCGMRDNPSPLMERAIAADDRLRAIVQPAVSPGDLRARIEQLRERNAKDKAAYDWRGGYDNALCDVLALLGAAQEKPNGHR